MVPSSRVMWTADRSSDGAPHLIHPRRIQPHFSELQIKRLSWLVRRFVARRAPLPATPQTTEQIAAATRKPRILRSTFVTWVEPSPVARMRLNAATCHHPLCSGGVCPRWCAGRHDPSEEWPHHPGRSRPRKRQSLRIRHRRRLLRHPQVRRRSHRCRRHARALLIGSGQGRRPSRLHSRRQPGQRGGSRRQDHQGRQGQRRRSRQPGSQGQRRVERDRRFHCRKI